MTEKWEQGKLSPRLDLTGEPGAGWHPGGLLLVCDDLTADDTFDRVHLTADGPLVGLTLQGPELTVDLLTGDVPDRPDWADPTIPLGSTTRVAFLLVLVDHQSQMVVRVRWFTVSPHLTQALRREALERFRGPLSGPEFMLATMAWRERFPDLASVRAGAIASSRIGD